MKVGIGAGGRFHILDLARQMLRLGHLGRLYTGYPSWKVDSLPRDKVSTHPWGTVPAQAVSRFNQSNLYRRLNFSAITNFDEWMARSLEPCDVLHTLSSFGTRSQKVARKKFGAMLVCDRGSSHISFQDEILREEFDLWKQKYTPIDSRLIERECEEYETADRIVVPSGFAYESFLRMGVPASKVRVAPLGVDLTTFHPAPRTDNVFRILFVGTLSLRKGLPYFLQAISELRLPNVEVLLIGGLQAEARPFLAKYEGQFQYLGLLPRTKLFQYYSQGSVLVLPSLEEGLALVQAQAMACGVPVIASTNTGAANLFEDGKEGFIVPIRNVEAIRDRILRLYHNSELQQEMSRNSLERVKHIGGWNSYGERMTEIYQEGLREISARTAETAAPIGTPAASRTALRPLRVSVSVGGKFHAFHLAEQLAKRGWLKQFLTTFFNPKRNAWGLDIPREAVSTNVLPELVSRVPGLLFGAGRGHWDFRKGEAFDRWAASELKPCDVFIGWSGFSLRTIKKARAQGATVILVRGSAHILTQKKILDEESFRFGQRESEVDSRTVEKELQEYELSDYIAMPSRYCERSFLEQGLPRNKLLVWPLGADTRRFSPPAKPRPDSPFRVLYVGEVSLQKGVYYLLEAFNRLAIPNSELILVGQVKKSFAPMLENQPANVKVVGVVRYPGVQRFFQEASAFVLPSIQDGFGQVVMQAMATGAPVVVSTNAGACEAITPGEDGLLFKARNIDELAFCLDTLYRYPELRRQMGDAALKSAIKYNWNEYGAIVESSLLDITGRQQQK